jgi:hypothetical protein
MDLTADGRQLIILTKRHAYLYLRSPQETWQAALERAPQTVSMPPTGDHTLVQREAICFDPHGHSLFATSESRPAPLYRLDRR